MSTFRETLGDWEVFNANLKAHLSELPDLEPGQQELEALVAQGFALSARQDQLIGELRDNNDQRAVLLKQARRKREILVASLRQKFGFESQRLLSFGVQPRGRRRSPGSGPTSGPETPEPVEVVKGAHETPPG